MIRLWRGQLPLESAFWNWAVAGGLAVNIVSSAAFLLLMLADMPWLAVLAGYGLSLPFNVLVTVGVWRSADRYEGDRAKAEFARTATIIGMILLSVT